MLLGLIWRQKVCLKCKTIRIIVTVVNGIIIIIIIIVIIIIIIWILYHSVKR